MPVAFRLKKSLNTKPKFSSGRAKETLGRVSSPDRRRHGSRETPRARGSEYESDDIDSEPYRRVRSPGRNSDSAVQSKHHRLVRERNGGEADSKGSFRSELTQRTRRADDVRAPSRKSSFVDGKHTRKDASAARRGEYSDLGEARPLRGHRGRRGDDRDGNDSDTKGSFRSELAQRTRRRADDDRDTGEEGKSLRVRAPSRKSSFVDGKHTCKDVSAARRGEHSDVGISRRNHGYAKQRNFAEDESNVEAISDGEARPLRGHRGRKGDDRDGKERKGDNRDGKDSDRRERRGANVEVLADKFRSKGRRRDGFISAGKCKGDAQVNYQKKMGNESVRTVFEDHQELKRYQARLLEKSGKRNVEPAAIVAPPNNGKRIASRKKTSDVEPAATDAPPKKRKRIKLDPYDTSNKRLDDVVSDNDHVEKENQEIKISMNAQFRSIQPSPSILSFVEDNLLGRRRLIELQNAGYNIKLSAPLDNIPFSTSTERDRIEENVFRNKLEFFAAAKISSSFPPPTIPEIAFAGRSNVGKSSLLNALTRQWGIVRTSEKPGYTQTINFFRLSSKLCLVDLPGYGFAYAKEEVKDAWEELVKEYVSTRVGLQRVCLLIDTKWGMKPRDHELIDLMERSETPYQIVLTKTDSVFPIDVARRAMQIEESMKINKSIVNPVMMLSSKSGAGVRSLRTVLAKLARFVKP